MLLKDFSRALNNHCSIRVINFISELPIVFEMFSLKSCSILTLLYLQGSMYVALKQLPKDTVESPSSEVLTTLLVKALSKPVQLLT